MAENATVAVLGTGIMGAAMARNLLAAEMEVRVWNRTREKADPLARDGAAVAASPAETRSNRSARRSDPWLTTRTQAERKDRPPNGSTRQCPMMWLRRSYERRRLCRLFSVR
jgi:3-hydroxyacyl-CoA dehydrogenase